MNCLHKNHIKHSNSFTYPYSFKSFLIILFDYFSLSKAFQSFSIIISLHPISFSSMAEFLEFRCEFEVTQGHEYILTQEGARNTVGLFLIDYNITNTFFNYYDNPSGEGLRFHNTSVEHSGMSRILDIDNIYEFPSTSTLDFFHTRCVPNNIVAEIRFQIQTRANFWLNDFDNPTVKILRLHVNVSTWASRPIDDEQQEGESLFHPTEENELMARVVTSSMEDENSRVYFPASPFSVESLEKVKYESAEFEMETCRVCLEEFEEGGEVMQMPCKHVYHEDCIVKWLKLSNLCPLCRFTLPFDYKFNDEI